jgi:hypothetical protein
MRGTNSQVQLQGGKTDAFEIHSGLKQEDGMAPMLFNLVLDWVLREIKVDLSSTLLY